MAEGDRRDGYGAGLAKDLNTRDALQDFVSFLPGPLVVALFLGSVTLFFVF